MKKVFPVKLLGPPRFNSPASKWFSIKNEKFFKECFFSFKNEEQLIKDNDPFLQVQNQTIHLLKPAFL